ncbi:MAG TPA: DUF6152 family protein [Gammaproteobacteria bacterium]
MKLVLERSGVAAAMLLVTLPAVAHHGSHLNPLLYFTDEMADLQGEVTEVFWRNPHTRLLLSVAGDGGEPEIWELELAPGPRSFEAMGITPESLMGMVRVAGYVSRRNPGSLGVQNLLLPDGREYVQERGEEPRWSNARLERRLPGANPARIQADEAAADGIFRMWDGGRINGAPASIEDDLELQTLTDRGRELSAAFDPLTDNGQLQCRHGMPDTMFDPWPMEIANEGDRIAINATQYNLQRIIYMNGSGPAGEPEATSVGYSVGRWEGDTLVVTTTHVDWPYYSNIGMPQSDQVSYLERFSVSNDGQSLNYSITVDDPVIFTRPFTMIRTRRSAPGVEIAPFDCVAEWSDAAG